MFSYKSLKSGTDIRGVAVEGVPGEPVNLTDEVIETIAAAFLVWVKLRLQITQTLKLNNSVLSPCRGWAGKEGVL